ncbi:hypothetical protein [Streptomyces sp. NPDC058751]|uniref:hypothetical protein n=1 Tax=Streptomyces sp. NPDC058751 TaxID=3346623 RepID=UPI00367FC205
MDALTRREFLERSMAESVPVRCPACRREHLYAAPSYPCACGSPVTAPIDPLAEASPVTHRAWDDEWTTVRCGACGRESQWPRPELGCPCGTTLRIPLRTAGAAPGARPAEPARDRADADAPARDTGDAGDAGTEGLPGGTREAGSGGGRGPREGAAEGRPALRPVTIRTARDAVTAAALCLGRLGYRDIRRADQRPTSGIGLAARGILAQVDPTARPATLRDVECLWLTAMTESANCVFFSLAGYAEDARARADALGVPLFVLDRTGAPRPVNSPADALVAVTDRPPDTD